MPTAVVKTLNDSLSASLMLKGSIPPKTPFLPISIELAIDESNARSMIQEKDSTRGQSFIERNSKYVLQTRLHWKVELLSLDDPILVLAFFPSSKWSDVPYLV
jgi:hypothetical protein